MATQSPHRASAHEWRNDLVENMKAMRATLRQELADVECLIAGLERIRLRTRSDRPRAKAAASKKRKVSAETRRKLSLAVSRAWRKKKLLKMGALKAVS